MSYKAETCRHDGKPCHEPNGGCQPCPRSAGYKRREAEKHGFMAWYCGSIPLSQVK